MDIEKRRIIYKRLADAFGFHQESEDIAQEAILLFLKRKTTRVANKYIVIDAIRSVCGRTNVNGESKYTRHRQSLSQDLEKEPLSDEGLWSIREFNALLQLVDKGEARAFLVLRFKYGFSMKELVYAFGYCDAKTLEVLDSAVLQVRDRYGAISKTR